MSYLVVDDFCECLDAVRDSALAAGIGSWLPNKGEVGTSVYDGMGFWGDHAPMLRSLMRNVGGVVIPNAMFFRSTNVGTERAYIHSDRESGNHSCITYLTQHAKRYGTAFYRHKRTGWREMPSFQQLHELGVLEEMKKDMVSRDADKWEQIDFVQGVKNRALIFAAPLFHSRIPLDGFGTTPDEGRMVWACHFNKLAPNGEFI